MDNGYAGALLYTALVIAAFYFLFYRPQQRQRKALAELHASLTPGNEVMTASGIIGRVVRVTDDVVHLEVASGVVVRVAKGAIASRTSAGDEPVDE